VNRAACCRLLPGINLAWSVGCDAGSRQHDWKERRRCRFRFRQFASLKSPTPLDTNPPRYGGLTSFGAAVIKECNRLGILIDLAHANMQTTEAALKVTTRPVIISHTGLDTQLGSDPRMAQMMRPRLISKEQAKLVANAGGLVAVWTHLSGTPLDYARNVRALVDVIGVEHVCIGTDTKLTQPSPRPLGPGPGDPGPGGAGPGGPRPGPRVGERTNLAWQDQTAGFYYAVVDAMLKTGFAPNEIGKIGGGNFLRLFGEAVRK
jgi:membrane dipeptidase